MLDSLFSNQFMPHGHCYLWRPEVLWTHVVSDAIVALAYFSIPLTLIYFLRRRPNVPFRLVIALFAGFIVLCGRTHIMGIWTVWNPTYMVEGLFKAATAGISIATAVALFPLVPQALTLRSAKELETANTALKEEIAQRKRVEQDLERSLVHVTQSNENLQQFAYVVSHDLQAPLRNINSFIELLEKEAAQKLSDDERQYLDFISKGASHMQSLVKDVLRLSKVGTSKEAFSSFSLGDVISDVREQIRSDLDQAGAAVDVKGEMPTVYGDRSQLFQILQNLVGNAIKFQTPGTAPRVTIRAEPLSDDEGRAAGSKVTVSDNGIGIPANKLERVFGAFQRLHSESEYEGSGVGLAICQKIVERHGGDISVESEVGVGTTFTFTLRAGPAEATPSGGTT